MINKRLRNWVLAVSVVAAFSMHTDQGRATTSNSMSFSGYMSAHWDLQDRIFGVELDIGGSSSGLLYDYTTDGGGLPGNMVDVVSSPVVFNVTIASDGTYSVAHAGRKSGSATGGATLMGITPGFYKFRVSLAQWYNNPNGPPDSSWNSNDQVKLQTITSGGTTTAELDFDSNDTVTNTTSTGVDNDVRDSFNSFRIDSTTSFGVKLIYGPASSAAMGNVAVGFNVSLISGTTSGDVPLLFPDPGPTAPCPTCPKDGEDDAASMGHAGDFPSPVAAPGVQLASGKQASGDVFLTSGSMGEVHAMALSPTEKFSYTSGYGMTQTDLPRAVDYGDGSISIARRGDTAKSYTSSGSGSWSPMFYSKSALAVNSTAHELSETTSRGTKTTFYDYDQTTNPGGSFKGSTDQFGNSISTTYSSGRITKMTRTPSSSSLQEEWDYSYISSGANAGLVSGVSFKRSTNSGSSFGAVIRQTANTYYNGTESYGYQGDLKLVQVKDGSGNVLDTTYYRYYTFGEANGSPHQIKYHVGPESYERLKAWATANSISDPTTVTDAQLADFADQYFEYDDSNRIVTARVEGSGCSCSGSSGQGTYSYAWSSNNHSTYTDGPNTWKTKVVETLPDSTQTISYLNYAGQVMLRVQDAAGTPVLHFQKFDSDGKLLWKAEPSAFTGGGYSDTYDDLMNFGGTNNSPYLSDSSGLIYKYTYGSSTTATSTTAGDVAGYNKSEYVQNGETATAILVHTQDYYSRTASSVTTYPVASSTVYRNTNGTGGITTSYSYTWFSGTQQMASRTTTLPVISTGQNGAGGSTGDQTVEYFDQFGHTVWSKDQAGYITYTGYDIFHGGVAKMVTDVDTSQTSDFLSGDSVPSGLSSPLSTRLRLATTYELDDLGRTTAETDPRGNVTYTVYKDTTYEVRTYPAWNSSTNAPLGPIQVSRADRAHNYRESLTMTATPSVSSSRPTGGESVASIQSLSRQVLDNSGRVLYSDRYFDLTSITYSTTSVTLGTSGTNYYRTTNDYDAAGRISTVTDPEGNVTSYYYSALGHLYEQDGATSFTQTTDYYGNVIVRNMEIGWGSGVPTSNVYDWRNRLIATKVGTSDPTDASSETSDPAHRTLVVYELDNLGNHTSTSVYDGDGVTVSVSGSTASVSDTSKLRAKSTASVDDLGRVYESKVYSVDQTAGTVSSTALTSETFYDSRGNVIKSSSPGGLVHKSVFDGAGRTTVSYVTDGGGDTAYADASSVSGDAVLEQTEYSYNKNGAVVLTVNRSRNHDETTTGALGNQSTAPKARVTYSTAFYDAIDRTIASVAYGTNGGTSVSAPSETDSVPSRSDTVLVTSMTYTAAGYSNEVTDPKGTVSKTYYDLLGRTTKTIAAYTNGTPTASSNQTTTYSYDGDDRIHQLTAVMPSGTNNQTTEYVYGWDDGNGGLYPWFHLTLVKYPDPSTGSPSSSTSHQVSYPEMDACGNVLETVDQKGLGVYNFYDSAGRINWHSNDATYVYMEYDALGHPTLLSLRSNADDSVINEVQRVYNGLGQLTTEYQSHSGAVNTSTTPRVQYAYTEMASSANHSRLKSMTYPNGRIVRYEYASGLDTTISRLSFMADDSSGSVGTHLEEYSYLGASSVIKRAHPQPGVDLTYIKQSGESNADAGDQYTGLDRFGRVVDQRWIVTSSGSHTDRFGYGYDRDSNRLYKNNLVASAQSELYHANGSSSSYDPLNRLTDFRRGTLSASGSVLDTVTTASHTQSWTLNALGNMPTVTTDGTGQSRTHNSENEITALGSTTVSSDDTGNLTNDGTQSYLYNARNQLVEVKNAAGTTSIVTYAYDALGRRITESPNGGTATEVYYSANWQALEDVQSGHAKNQYVWSPVYIDAMVERDRDADNDGSHTLEERLYAQQDANYTLTSVINTSGSVQERYLFDPYAARTVTDASFSPRSGNTSSFAWTYGHQGLEHDAETGLVYARNRMYSTTLARWLQADSFFQKYIDGPNLYQLCHSNPINNSDPLGWATFGGKPANGKSIAIETADLSGSTPMTGWDGWLYWIGSKDSYMFELPYIDNFVHSELELEEAIRWKVWSVDNKDSLPCRVGCVETLTLSGHGAAGVMDLGFGDLSTTNFTASGTFHDEMMKLLQEISFNLCDHATLYLDACDVGKGPGGDELLKDLVDYFRTQGKDVTIIAPTAHGQWGLTGYSPGGPVKTVNPPKPPPSPLKPGGRPHWALPVLAS